MWFLSRDCEAMFEALQVKNELFDGAKIKYIYTSRQATYPIIAAVHKDELFANGMGVRLIPRTGRQEIA